MTSKRLGILLFILAVVWSVAGLGWLTPIAGDPSAALPGVRAAQADPPGGIDLFTSYTVDGDPDSFAHSPTDDDDSATPSDSTSTTSSSGGGKTGGTPTQHLMQTVGIVVTTALSWIL